MSESAAIHEPGETIIVTDGEYSEYGIIGVFIVERTFDANEEQARFIEADPKGAWNGSGHPSRDSLNTSAFVAWLNRNHIIREITARELRLRYWPAYPHAVIPIPEIDKDPI